MENKDINSDNNLIRKINQDSITLPTPKKENNLVKPDFSPILLQQNQLSYKKYGSYKKPKFIEPESPMKSPNFKSSVKMQGKNLFGSSNPEDLANCKFSKKLNFDEYCDDKNNFLGNKNYNNGKDVFQKNSKLNMFLEKCDEEEEDNFNSSKKQNEAMPSPKFGIGNTNNFAFEDKDEPKNGKRTRSIRKCSINIESNLEILRNGKFEKEFHVIKNIKQDTV